ncbi:hypothetical protein [Lysobacter sp. CA196]|uniref:hypothetical protein n=1 Tax=Lysobacter sp. CA196 TaxID=3455606 RepID=UPI003F8D055B
MSYPDCQYSHVTWVRKDSAAFQALSEGLKNPHTAPGAVTTFLANMTAAHEAFKRGLRPHADMMALLRAYQDATGIISTREYTLPDIPSNPNDPGNNFANDLIEGIAGAAMTEIGIGISLYNLVLDLIEIFNIKLHLQGVLFNTASTDLENIDFRFGPNGLPNILPLSATIPAAKSIMNPVDKKNYDCVGFTLFGGVGGQSLEGFYIAVTTQRKKNESPPPIYCQYYAQDRGIAPGFDDRNHAPLREVCYEGNVTGVMVEQGSNPNGVVAIVYG